MRIPGLNQAINNLVEWSNKAKWTPFREDIFEEHLEVFRNHFQMTDDDIMDNLGDRWTMLFGFIIEDLFSTCFGEEGEINIIDDDLSRRGWRETVPAKRYFEALRDSPPWSSSWSTSTRGAA